MAQTPPDTTYLLPPQTIYGERMSIFASGSKHWAVDSLQKKIFTASGFDELMFSVSPINVRSYGLGGLTTFSFRGMGSQQTTMEWNGVSIQNPMNGVADLALLNTFFVDELQLLHSNQSSLQNVGNVGGGIYVENKAKYQTGFLTKSVSSIGSFGKLQQGLQIGMGGLNMASSVKMLYQRAHNRYPFYNNTLMGSPKKVQTNAEAWQYGVLQENYKRWKGKNELRLLIWYQNARRNIPPPMTAAASTAWQHDQSVRTLAGWKFAHKKLVMDAKTAYMLETLHYSDEQSGINSESKTQTLQTDVEAGMQFSPRFLLSMRVNHGFQTANADNLPQNISRNQTSVAAMLLTTSKTGKANASASIKQSLVDKNLVPMTAAVGGEIEFASALRLAANFTKNFRLPTFNDLFWQPGGNPNLKPEDGWAQEFTASSHWSRQKWAFKTETTLFSNLLNNRILWLPTIQNATIWQPENIGRVWARGLDSEIEIRTLYIYVQTKIKSRYGLQIATPLTKGAEGHQLIYLPIHTFQNSITFSRKNIALVWQQNYTGKRFTTTDNTAFLPPFWITHLSVLTDWKLKKVKINAGLKVNNLFNARFQLIEYRPMPLRYGEIVLEMMLNG